MKGIGIDIGTTTICGIVIDAENGTVLDVTTLPNDALCVGQPFERLQDPEKIMQIVGRIYQEYLRKYEDICSVGITGQMHGIVYTDRNGKAVSPLYTWQDESGSINAGSSANSGSCDGSIVRAEGDTQQATCAQELSAAAGYPMASGFGITTFYVHTKQGTIPEEAVSFCTIPDYCAMRLTNAAAARITPSMAASLGCFDLQKLEFDKPAMQKAGLDTGFLPECQNGYILIGRTPEGIPVSAAIGDNQASVIGSVKDPFTSVLINVGTGSQVSVGVDHFCEAQHVELRPLTGSSYILAGSSLCGGRAYAALERFFEETVEAMTGKKCDQKLYGRMEDLLKEAEETRQAALNLTADTRFCGTREDPSLKGSITNLTLDNFTPKNMIQAVLAGITQELITYYEQIRALGTQPVATLVGSGNGLRRNRYLRALFEEAYHLPMQLPQHHEEAAFGAALYAMCAAGVKKSLGEAQELIRYEEADHLHLDLL